MTRADQPDLSAALQLAYLQAQLARLDVAIRRELWRWQRAGQDPRDAYRGLYLSDGDAASLARRPAFLNWGAMAPDDAQGQLAFEIEQKAADETIRRLQKKAAAGGISLRLEQVRERFGLDPFEMSVLLLVLAPSFDLRYERLYGFLQDDIAHKQPSINLALDLFAGTGVERLEFLHYFGSSAALYRGGLLEQPQEAEDVSGTLISQALRASETLAPWLLGEYQPPAACRPAFSLVDPQDRAEDRVLCNSAPDLDKLCDVGSLPILACFGPDSLRQQAAARQFAARQDTALLEVNLGAISRTQIPVERAVGMALRDARMTGALPFLAGWDAALPTEGPPALPDEVLTALDEFPGPVITSGLRSWRMPGSSPRQQVRVEFPIPESHERMRLWQHFLGYEEPQAQFLAGQFKLTSAQIRDAVRMARDDPAWRGKPLEPAALYEAAQAQSNTSLASLARKITSHYTWADMILPEDRTAQLEEIVASVRWRSRVMEDWGVGRKLASGQGITVLFAGSPGTGKTMAAGIIAAELGLELYKIDLSGVVSKYIGETEKNLEKIFQEAGNSNAILFFDEADAIFGKRSEVHDAHDRYANIEISYLLQRMDAYDGVTILATNLRANLDEAFTRRLQFAVDFPFPDEADRLRIWQTLFPQEVPHAPDLDFARMARRYKLAGGNIRNILQGAAFLAAADGGLVTMEHLVHSARRELQKMGRLPVEEV